MSVLPLVLLAAQAAGAQATTRELAGRPLTRYPHFENVQTFNEGDPVYVAFDPRSDRTVAKRTLDVFVIDHDARDEFLLGRKLASLTGRPLTVRTNLEGPAENTFLLDTGTLRGGTGTILGHGYDVVVDVNADARLDAGDLVDGDANAAGFYVAQDFVTLRAGTKETGPYSVVEVLYDGGTNFTHQDVYYPANIAELGEVPLIVVSHGNGHSYLWYDHIGYHLASWGYVVMAHTNQTGPGIDTAATTTLRNTNRFFARTSEIAGGVLVGHVDRHRIVWIGHSRGGEGVVWAYRRLLNGDPLGATFGPEDVRLVSSMAPVDFLGVGNSDVGSVPYHLWTGGADADVNGCANCDICQTFHLLERADGPRFSISLHGAGHGDFHDGGGSSVANGPCRIGRSLTHTIMRGQLLPLVQFVLDGNPACRDFLVRQYEEFRPLGAPAFDEPCVSVDLQYQPEFPAARRVIDDFQSNPAHERSSSGGEVVASRDLAVTLVEGRLDDADAGFTPLASDPMNGMTLAGPGDVTRGLVLQWDNKEEYLSFEVPAGERDLTGHRYLSFRAAQMTRQPITTAELGDLDFTVELADGALQRSAIAISAYGGGIEEPYQRGACGTGNGWANDFETIRIPLDDFRRDGRALDLSNVVAITFLFGPRHGSPAGHIGLDEIELTHE